MNKKQVIAKNKKGQNKLFSFKSSKMVSSISMLIIIAAIPLTVGLSQHRVDIQQHASGISCGSVGGQCAIFGMSCSKVLSAGNPDCLNQGKAICCQTYSCSSGNSCLPNANGGYIDSSCNNQCSGGGVGPWFWNDCNGSACTYSPHSYPGGANQCSPAGSTSNNGCSGGSGGGGNCKTLSQYNQCAKSTQGCVQNYPSGNLVHVTHTSCGYTCTDAGRVPGQCGVPPAGTQCNTTGSGSACTSSCSNGQYCESEKSTCKNGIPDVNVYVCDNANHWNFKYSQSGSYHNACSFSCQNNGGGNTPAPTTNPSAYTKYQCGTNGVGRCVLDANNSTTYSCSAMGTNWSKLYKDNDPSNPHACQTQTKSVDYKCCAPQ